MNHGPANPGQAGSPRGDRARGHGPGGYEWYGGRAGGLYGGTNYGYPGYNYPGRYGSGYRGYNYGSGVRFGLGRGFGAYGYSFFPWYGGLGFYGGPLYGARGYNGYGFGNYGYGNYGGGYYSRGTSVPAESQQVAEEVPADQDYVPQLNSTTAELAAAASGGAVLGIVMDGQYPEAAVVRDVTPGGPADQAGLRPGDMITSIDKKLVQSADDVVKLVGRMQPGTQIALDFVRPVLRSEVQAAAPVQQPTATIAPRAATPAPPAPAPELIP